MLLNCDNELVTLDCETRWGARWFYMKKAEVYVAQLGMEQPPIQYKYKYKYRYKCECKCKCKCKCRRNCLWCRVKWSMKEWYNYVHKHSDTYQHHAKYINIQRQSRLRNGPKANTDITQKLKSKPVLSPPNKWGGSDGGLQAGRGTSFSY